MNAQTLRSPVLGGVHLAARPARPHAGPRHGLAAAPPGAARRSGTPAQAAHRPSPAPEEPPAPAPRPSPPTAQPRRPAGLLGALPGGAGPLALGAGLLGASGVDFSGPGGTLSALAVLAAVVGVHEAGHFTAARLQNIHVTKFAIGFGPALLKFTRGPVEYSLRAFPLGGFVAFPDDDPDSPFPEDDPDLLRNRPVLDRMLVTVAGVAANVAFAYALCVTQAATVGIVDPVYLPGVRIGPINPGTVAERAGIRRGDLLLRVGGLEVAPAPGSVDAVVGLITRNPGKELEVEVRRDGAPLALRVTPAEMPDGTGRIGVSLGPNVRVDRQKAAGVGQALALGAKDFRAVAGTVLTGLSQLVGNFKETAPQVSGPVAILAVGSEVARADATGLYRFAAIINVNLAVVNLLPLPALDGGYLALQLLEVVRRGKKLDVELERGIMASGFLLLTSLGIFMIARDAINLTSKL